LYPRLSRKSEAFLLARPAPLPFKTWIERLLRSRPVVLSTGFTVGFGVGIFVGVGFFGSWVGEISSVGSGISVGNASAVGAGSEFCSLFPPAKNLVVPKIIRPTITIEKRIIKIFLGANRFFGLESRLSYCVGD